VDQRGEQQRQRHHHERRHQHQVEVVPQREPEDIVIEEQPFEIKPARPRACPDAVPMQKRPAEGGQAGQQHEHCVQSHRRPHEAERYGGAQPGKGGRGFPAGLRLEVRPEYHRP